MIDDDEYDDMVDDVDNDVDDDDKVFFPGGCRERLFANTKSRLWRRRRRI